MRNTDPEPAEMKALWKTIQKMTSLFDPSDKYYRQVRVTGSGCSRETCGNCALFFVIRHPDLKAQEKYLPMMRQAVKDGKANGSQLAMLEDTVARLIVS
jgi:hypothetical protein